MYETRDTVNPRSQQAQYGYDSLTEAQNTETQDPKTQNPKTQDPEIQDPDVQDADMHIWKSMLAQTGVQWAILNKTVGICENTYTFENPFPTCQEDRRARCDAWSIASRQYDIKGLIPEMEDSVDQFVSTTLHASRYILIQRRFENLATTWNPVSFS